MSTRAITEGVLTTSASEMVHAPAPDKCERLAMQLLQVPADGPRLVLQEERSISAVVGAGTDVVTDCSYGLRLIPGCEVLDPTLGLTTGLNAFLGVDGIKRARVRADEAARVGYTEGERTAMLDTARCVVQTVGGAAYFGVRGLALASQLKGVDATSVTAPTLLGRITFIFASVGSAIWGIFYIFLAVICGRDIRSAARLRTELLDACKLTKAPEEMSLDELSAYVRFFEKHAGLHMPDETEETLKEEAIQHRMESIKKHAPNFSDEELRAVVLKMIAMEGAELGLHIEGLALRQEKHKAKCALELATLVGADSAQKLLEIIQASADEGVLLSDRIQAGDLFVCGEAARFIENTQPLVAKMEETLDVSIRMNTGYMTACAIGLAATVASFFALNPIGLIAVTVAFVVMVIIMSVLDGYRFHKALDEVQPGKFDTTILTISTVIGLLSAAASIAVVSALSLGLVPLIAAIAIAAIWIAVNAKTWHAVKQHEATSRRLSNQHVDILGDQHQKIGISVEEALACRVVTEVTPEMLAVLEYTG
jgi:hypothetical protein